LLGPTAAAAAAADDDDDDDNDVENNPISKKYNNLVFISVTLDS